MIWLVIYWELYLLDPHRWHCNPASDRDLTKQFPLGAEDRDCDIIARQDIGRDC